MEEARNDPKVVRARAELSWIGVMTGKPTEGLDPELKKRIDTLRQDAIARIMTDPQAYERDLQEAKARFFQSRGIDSQNKPNP